jgi:hypothetical protein
MVKLSLAPERLGNATIRVAMRASPGRQTLFMRL